MKTVRDLLNVKGNEVISIAPDEMVFEALKVMAQRNIGALLVMDGAKLIGIMSERDYARKVIMRGKSSKETTVRDIMTARLLVVNPGTSLEECMTLMTDAYVRHLPVVEDGKVVGVVSIRDVVKATISEKRGEGS